MFLQTLKRVAVLTTAVVVGVGLVAAPAQATGSESRTRLSGRTTVVTAPGIATTLLRAGILPVVTRPGTFGIRYDDGLAIAASFPVTGGSVALDPPSGRILHRGGIKFVNLRNGKSLEVGNFTINLNSGKLTGAVNRSSTRVAVFDLDLSRATIKVDGRRVTVRRVGLKLTAGAADALNQSLGVKLFAGGLMFGSAKVRLVLPKG